MCLITYYHMLLQFLKDFAIYNDLRFLIKLLYLILIFHIILYNHNFHIHRHAIVNIFLKFNQGFMINKFILYVFQFKIIYSVR